MEKYYLSLSIVLCLLYLWAWVICKDIFILHSAWLCAVSVIELKNSFLSATPGPAALHVLMSLEKKRKKSKVQPQQSTSISSLQCIWKVCWNTIHVEFFVCFFCQNKWWIKTRATAHRGHLFEHSVYSGGTHTQRMVGRICTITVCEYNLSKIHAVTSQFSRNYCPNVHESSLTIH